MTKESLWLAILQKNPKFETHGADFSERGLRKFFDTVWKHAYDEGFDVAVRCKKEFDKSNPLDIFDGIFNI